MIFEDNFNNSSNEAFFFQQNYNNYGSNIAMPLTEYSVFYKEDFVTVRKQCLIVSERIDFKNLVQIRLTEKDDQTKMFMSTINTTFFTELKKDQSLHVTFNGFIDNLIKIFKECQQEKLHISLVKDKSKNGYSLQFHEHRPFKNLLHLCLPIKEAPVPVVLYFMNQNLKVIQKKNESYLSNLEYSQKELEKNSMLISQLKKENEKLTINLREKEDYYRFKEHEDIRHLQENIEKLKEERMAEEKKYKQFVTNLQNEIERLKTDNMQINIEKEKQGKRVESLNEEICIIKSNYANLKEQNEKLHSENLSLKTCEKRNEALINDLNKQHQDMKEKLKYYEKIKSELLAEIEAEKKLCHTKRTALEIASEEISKANDKISKQCEEIQKLKKTIDWKTEVTLQQEIAFKEKEKLLYEKSEQLMKLYEEIKSMRNESNKFFEHLDGIKCLTDVIQHKYNERIQNISRQLMD